MADFVDEAEREYENAIREGMRDLMIKANDVLRNGEGDVIRVDTNENRAAAIGNWAPGVEGGDFRPAPGTEVADPGDGAARTAAADYQIGEGTSTTVNTDHDFWITEDETFEKVAEALA